MEEVTRVRLPRAFVYNEIGVYHDQLAKAQNCIQHYHVNERIMIFLSAHGFLDVKVVESVSFYVSDIFQGLVFD